MNYTPIPFAAAAGIVCLPACWEVRASPDATLANATPIDGAAPSVVDAAPPMMISLGGDPQPLTVLGNTAIAEEFSAACPDGQAMIRFAGELGETPSGYDVVGILQGHCGELRLGQDATGYRVATEPGMTLPPHGSDDSLLSWNAPCPADQFIVGLSAWSGTRVDRITVRCAPLLIKAAADGWTVERGHVTALVEVGGNGGAEPGDIGCVAPAIATEVVGHVESEIGAIGLVCRTPIVR